MASVAASAASAPAPPPAEPSAIRACLDSALIAEFDREWEIVLDRVKQSMDLADLHELLNKWRHTAYMEKGEPGSYHRMLGKAEQILRSGGNSDAVPFEEMQDLIRNRRGQMYRIVPDRAAMAQVAALPPEALDSYAEVLEVLQLTPWAGHPQHTANPDGAVRRSAFGTGKAGQVV